MGRCRGCQQFVPPVTVISWARKTFTVSPNDTKGTSEPWGENERVTGFGGVVVEAEIALELGLCKPRENTKQYEHQQVTVMVRERQKKVYRQGLGR